MAKKVFIAFGIAILCFFGFASLQPDSYEIKRSKVIAAGPDVVWNYINNFNQ